MSAKYKYKFDTLELTFDGLGLPFLSDKTKSVIAGMTKENASAVNRSAWKQRNAALRVANRSNNFSVPGNIRAYDENSQLFNVAKLVCNETYKVMIRD